MQTRCPQGSTCPQPQQSSTIRSASHLHPSDLDKLARGRAPGKGGPRDLGRQSGALVVGGAPSRREPAAGNRAGEGTRVVGNRARPDRARPGRSGAAVAGGSNGGEPSRPELGHPGPPGSDRPAGRAVREPNREGSGRGTPSEGRAGGPGRRGVRGWARDVRPCPARRPLGPGQPAGRWRTPARRVCKAPWSEGSVSLHWPPRRRYQSVAPA